MTDQAQTDEAPLESWKAIAAYLNRDVKTAKRWEHTEGLPVHRHRHLSRSSVYAFPSEIDAWRLKRRSSQREAVAEPPRRTIRPLVLVLLILAAIATSGGGRVASPLHLNARGQSAATATTSVVAPEGSTGGNISADGRYLPFTDWSSGNLALRDFTTGEVHRLTDTGALGTVQQYADRSRVSPDGSQVAFGWLNGQHYEIRMIPTRARPPERPRTVYTNPDVEYIQPFDWSPDGTQLAVGLRRGDRSGQIALLEVATGRLTPLRSFSWRGSSEQMLFSPDGRYLGYDQPADDPTGHRDVSILSIDGSRDSPVSASRSDELMVGWSPDGSSIVFASDRTGSRQLWAQRVRGGVPERDPLVIPSDFRGTPIGLTRTGALYFVALTVTGSPFRVGQVDLKAGRLEAPARDPGEDLFSVNRRASAEWSPDGRSIAFVRRDRLGQLGMVIAIQDVSSGRRRSLRPELPTLGETRWMSDSTAMIATGVDLKRRAGLFRIDAATGGITMLAAAPAGVTFQSPWPLPGGKSVIYLREVETGTAIVLRDLRSGAERVLVEWPAKQVAVSSLRLAPDGRHVGVVLAPQGDERRRAVLVSTTTGQTTELMAADVRAMQFLLWAPDSNAVFIRTTPPTATAEVHLVTLHPLEVRKIDWGVPPDARDLQLHPDGRRLVYVDGSVSTESNVRRIDRFFTLLPQAR